MGADGYPARHFSILLEVAREGSVGSKISTTKLAKKTGISQQSASRILKEMEKSGLISRKVFIDGQIIKINKEGEDILRKVYDALGNIFSKKKTIVIGEVVTGVGEGRYYVGLKGYRKQFKEKLNFLPYPGTLNLKVDEKIGGFIHGISECLLIEGFKTKKRSFGGLKCINAKIEYNKKSIHGAVVMPFRTIHDDSIIEVIAPFYLRGKLGLKDGDKIRVVV